MTFSTLDRHEYFEDMGIFKNDMVKAEGHWAGYLVNPLDNVTKIYFYEISGII